MIRRQAEDRRKLQEQIDENLRRVYREALEEEVPDRFRELLEQLRRKEAGE
jgi:predicted metal-dependent hydrolase